MGYVLPMAWDLTNFLSNSTSQLKTWGGMAFTLIGVVMIIVAIVKIAKALISHGKTQTSWPINIALLLVGGALSIGGAWGWVSGIAQGGKQTIDDLGNTALPSVLFSAFMPW